MGHLQQLTSYQQAINFLFPPEILSKPIEAIKRSFLSPYNIVVDEFNKKMIKQIHSEECKL